MGLLEIGQLAIKRVVFLIADGGRGLLVIAAIVLRDLTTKNRDAFGGGSGGLGTPEHTNPCRVFNFWEAAPTMLPPSLHEG